MKSHYEEKAGDYTFMWVLSAEYFKFRGAVLKHGKLERKVGEIDCGQFQDLQERGLVWELHRELVHTLQGQ